MRRLRYIAWRVRDTFRWLRRYWRTAPADRFGLVPRRIVKAPMCWVLGHTWEHGRHGMRITNWTLQSCQRCSEEIAGRTGFHQIIARPDDEPAPCDEFFADDYDDPSPVDWDDARDRAIANGGPF